MPILSPKLTRNLSRILPFGIIWLVIGWVFLLTETLVTGNQNLSPEAAVTLTWPVFIFASISVMMMGFVVGFIEMVILEKRFRNFSFRSKVFYKLLIYMGFMLLITFIFFPIATSVELGSSLIDVRVWERTRNFFQSLIFLNTLIQLSFHVLVSVLYAAISENLGHPVIQNIFLGKYHKPQKEQRIFMFLDMKDSTTIAEKLGHVRYFDLLQAYYEAMSDPIILNQGEVYQYIGDEVVITWLAEKGFEANHCVQCFFDIKASLQSQADKFQTRFGLVPDFKAGLHAGEVSAGEIGALKKEIVYTGDVLNTTARIQGQCKTYQRDLLISEALLKGLKHPEKLSTKSLGELQLKGKESLVPIYAVETLG